MSFEIKNFFIPYCIEIEQLIAGGQSKIEAMVKTIRNSQFAIRNYNSRGHYPELIEDR